MGKIRQRLYVIGALIVVSIISLVPRNVKMRVRDSVSGAMKDTTVRRVPINLGLDLQGGIHLALEVDQSKGPERDCADAIQRAERVVRTRIDEFGTTEPVVQIQGRCRLIVELAGEKDPARAKSVIQRTAFLEFRITDMKNQFKDALPQIDAALRRAGIKSRGAAPPSAVSQLFGGDSSKAERDSTTDANTPGVLSSLLFQGQLPGEYLVPEEQWPLVDSLVQRPDVKAAMPRGIELRWGVQSESRGARAYRALYAVESKPIITGEELVKAVARRAARAPHDCRRAHDQRHPRGRFHSRRRAGGRGRRAARDRDHDRLLPALRRPRGRRTHAVLPVHAGGAGGVRLHPHPAGARRVRAVDRHRRRRKRPHLRAHPRRAGAWQVAAAGGR